MEWKHKEDSWREPKACQSGTHTGWIVRDGIPSYEHMDPWDWEKNDVHLSFPEWLDLLCNDGWEVLKISRDFNSSLAETWVVFRKQV